MLRIPDLAPITPPAALVPLMHAHAVQPIVAHLLATRGLTPDTPLRPEITLAPLPNLDAAAKLIAEHVRDGNRILVHGDYDADGITGTAVLLRGLEELGHLAQWHIPNRLTDPYGLHAARVDELAPKADLIITVDCGIANREVVAEYRKRKVDVVVTDHHPTERDLPDALIVHPTALGRQVDFDLTGAGVAYHLLWAIRRELGHATPPAAAHLIAAAIGTIADVASITSSNRALIQHALRAATEQAAELPPGLLLLIARLGSEVNATGVAFRIAPLLNAAARLGHADDSVRLLLTDSDRKANALLATLERYNHERGVHQQRVIDDALARVNPNASAIVLDNPDWHAGVIGIAAANLCETYNLPTYLSSGGRGSARTPQGVHATDALKAAAEALNAYGGHAAAAGFSVAPGAHERFRELLEAHHRQHPAPELQATVEALLPETDVDATLLAELDALEPRGVDNPPPALALVAPLRGTRVIGKDRSHLQVTFDRSATPQRGVAWGQAHLAPNLPTGLTALALVELSVNEYQGNSSIQFSTRRVQPHAPLTTANEAPERITREPGLRAPNARTLRDLPDEALAIVAHLEDAHASGDALHYALSPDDLRRLDRSGGELLTRDTVRRHAAQLHREGRAPAHALADACTQVLREVDLLDGDGRLRVEARNLYRSDTLVRHALAQYQLTQLAQHYRYADARAFALATERLFGLPSGAAATGAGA